MSTRSITILALVLTGLVVCALAVGMNGATNQTGETKVPATF